MGQFSIFGAIEEKDGHGFSRIGMDEQQLREESFCLWMAEVLTWTEDGRRNLVEWAAGMSTGRAQEMQKGSGQWAVVGGQFLRLRC